MTDYADIGLGMNLIKELPKVYDVDLAIDDESIWGIKLAKKSVALDRLYGDSLQIGGSSNISGALDVFNSAMAKISSLDATGYHGYDTATGSERITIDATTGIDVVNASGNNAFKVYSTGAHVGDVQIGVYDNVTYTGHGCYYDSATDTFFISGTVAATELRIGTQPSWFRADSSGNIWSGALNYPDAVANTFAVSNAGDLYAQKATIAGSSTWTGQKIAQAYIGNLSTDILTSGTLYVGNAGRPGLIEIRRNGSDGFLTWQGGNKIWSDNDEYMGFTADGERFYFYTGAAHLYALFQRGQPASFYSGGAFSGGELKITDNNLYWYDSRLADGHNRYVFKSNDGVERFSITPDASPNTKLSMNGFTLRLTSDKTAIMPTSDGYKALYCAEAPEVWFFDFVGEDKKTDPLFDNVTEGESKYIKVEGGGYQVWRKRKGKSDLRFTPKTAEEFERNEAFYKQAN